MDLQNFKQSDKISNFVIEQGLDCYLLLIFIPLLHEKISLISWKCLGTGAWLRDLVVMGAEVQG